MYIFFTRLFLPGRPGGVHSPNFKNPKKAVCRHKSRPHPAPLTRPLYTGDYNIMTKTPIYNSQCTNNSKFEPKKSFKKQKTNSSQKSLFFYPVPQKIHIFLRFFCPVVRGIFSLFLYPFFLPGRSQIFIISGKK